ncbi:MAG: DUF2007 domain-containing protein [Bacteroidales bacterium]|jgi:hypothetical protein|nr:DUF2007 domain-containing protein [Bacteroidales bacterium]
MKREEEFKTVAEFNDALSAQITVGMLRENGIPAAVFGADSTYLCLNYVYPVQVKVNASDYETALKLIEQTEEASEESTEETTEG